MLEITSLMEIWHFMKDFSIVAFVILFIVTISLMIRNLALKEKIKFQKKTIHKLKELEEIPNQEKVEKPERLWNPDKLISELERQRDIIRAETKREIEKNLTKSLSGFLDAINKQIESEKRELDDLVKKSSYLLDILLEFSYFIPADVRNEIIDRELAKSSLGGAAGELLKPIKNFPDAFDEKKREENGKFK